MTGKIAFAGVLALGGCLGPPPEPPPPSLTVGVLAVPSGLDPAQHDEPATDAVAKDVFATLVRVRPGTSDVVAGIASAWSVSPDGTAWTFSLRKNLQFSDGTPLDAAAVKFNFDRWRLTKDPNRGYGSYPQYAARFGGYDEQSRIVDVDAPAPDTVVVRLREPYAPLLRDLALPAFGIGSPKAIAYSVDAYDEAPAASGPYRIDDVAQGDHVTLVRNPLWSGDAPAYASSVVRFIPDPPTSVLALEKRDVAAILDPTLDILQKLAPLHERLVHAPRGAVCYLAFDATRPPFDDQRLREAVADAVDAGAIARIAGPSAQPARGLLPPGMLGGQPAPAALQHDLDAARMRVHQAQPPGTITLYYPASPSPLLLDPAGVAQELKNELAAAGLNVDPQPTAAPVVIPAPGPAGALGLIVTEAPSGEPDDVFGPLSDQWDDPGFHAALAQARATIDDGARAKIYRRLNATVHDLTVAVPLVYPVAVSAVAPELDLDAYPIFAADR